MMQLTNKIAYTTCLLALLASGCGKKQQRTAIKLQLRQLQLK